MMQRFIGFVAIAATTIALHALPARAGDKVTGILKSGERLERVEYRVVPAFYVVEFVKDGVKRNVSFSDIEAIVDDEGRDITADVMGERYRPRGATAAGESAEGPGSAPADPDTLKPVGDGGVRTVTGNNSPGEPWVSEHSPAWKASRQAPWRVAFSLESALGVPFGDYYDGTKSGAGIEGTLHIALTRDVALRANVALLGLEFSDEMHLVSLDPNVEIVSQEYDINAVRYTGGVEYHQPLRSMEPGGSFWFVHASLGVIRHDIQGKLVIRNTYGQTAEVEASDTPTKFTMTSGAGIFLPVSQKLGFQLGGDVDGVWTEVYYEDGTSSVGIRGWVMTLHAGLTLVL
jgi:hypothetical protein